MTDFSLPIEVVAVAIASLVLILAVRYPHPAHLSTTILLTLFTGVLLWANLRPTAWEEECRM